MRGDHSVGWPSGAADAGAGGADLLDAGLGFRLGRLHRALRAAWAQQLDGLGLTPPQAAVLRGVAGRHGCSLRALARVLGTEPMTAKRCVDDLERRGFVESAHRGPDRRPRALQLTAEGRVLVRRLDVLARRQEEQLATILGARRSQLEAAVAALEAALGLPSASREEER